MNFASIRQEVADEEVKECTFNPNMEAYTKSKQLLRNK